MFHFGVHWSAHLQGEWVRVRAEAKSEVQLREAALRV
jgi:hypothetical protein